MSAEVDLLRARARRLAARPNTDAPARALDPVLIVRIGPERFALRMDAVDRVLPLGLVSAVPRSAPLLHGVMAVRGEIYSIYHLDRVLDLPRATEKADGGQVVLLKGERRAGVRVDGVESIDHVDRDGAVTADGGRAFVTPLASPALILLENVSSLIAKLAGEGQ